MRLASFCFLHYREVLYAFFRMQAAEAFDDDAPSIGESEEPICGVATYLRVDSESEESGGLAGCGLCKELSFAVWGA